MQSVDNDSDKENKDPMAHSQPMPRRAYFPGTSRLLTIDTIPGGVRDRGILYSQREREFAIVRWRITLLTRYMIDEPFPGDAIIEDLRLYWGRDYDRDDLEAWLRVLDTANYYCDPMTYEEYLIMRTAKLTMMRTMLSEIPGVTYRHPALWYTFDTMGQLLDALTTWPHPLIGQMEVVNEFFNNPQWLPINLEPFPIIAMSSRV